MVYQLEYYKRFLHLGIKDRVLFEEYQKLEKKEDLLRDVEFFIMGRAPYKLKNLLEEYSTQYPADHFSSQECITPFLRVWHNHFDNHCNYIPGFCGGISLGDCRELDILLQDGVDTEQYPVLGLLMDNNMRGLFEFAKSSGYKEIEDGYFSKCHLCMDIRKHLALSGDFRELQPEEFYRHLKE